MVKKAFGPLWIAIISTFMTHPNISLRFRVAVKRVKNFSCPRISIAARNFFGSLLRSQFWCHRHSFKRCFFFYKISFPAKWSTFAYSMWYIFGKLMYQRSIWNISGNNFSASYEVLEFCWQIANGSQQHLRPLHTENEIINNNIT